MLHKFISHTYVLIQQLNLYLLVILLHVLHLYYHHHPTHVCVLICQTLYISTLIFKSISFNRIPSLSFNYLIYLGWSALCFTILNSIFLFQIPDTWYAFLDYICTCSWIVWFSLNYNNFNMFKSKLEIKLNLYIEYLM